MPFYGFYINSKIYEISKISSFNKSSKIGISFIKFPAKFNSIKFSQESRKFIVEI